MERTRCHEALWPDVQVTNEDYSSKHLRDDVLLPTRDRRLQHRRASQGEGLQPPPPSRVKQYFRAIAIGNFFGQKTAAKMTKYIEFISSGETKCPKSVFKVKVLLIIIGRGVPGV